jgi:hypothetical protein
VREEGRAMREESPANPVARVVSGFLCVGRFFVFGFFDSYDVESGSKLDGELR